MKYDFGGYATRNNLTCTDGRVIKKDAFKSQNGETVPLVWNHNHDVDDVLGLAHLENREDGVYAYCEFNDTEKGKTAKELVQHGDVRSLSIFANQLMQKGSDVIHGLIREVSLVIAGANPGAFIDDVIAHGEDGSGIIVCYDEGVTVFMHSDDKPDDEEKTKDRPEDKKKEKLEDDETVEDVFDSLTEKQKTAVYAVIGTIMEDNKNNDDSDDNEGGKEEMKHNVFENGAQAQAQDNTLSHADQVAILETAKMRTVGTFKNALQMYAEENALQHDAISSGVATGDISKLFPEYAEVRPGAPELITNDQGWISTVISKVHKSPMSRIRTTQADIRNIDTLKAHGYQKGKQ